MMTMESIDLGDANGIPGQQTITIEKTTDNKDVPVSLDQINIETSEERCENVKYKFIHITTNNSKKYYTFASVFKLIMERSKSFYLNK